jgi:hypothetical protein
MRLFGDPRFKIGAVVALLLVSLALLLAPLIRR